MVRADPEALVAEAVHELADVARSTSDRARSRPPVAEAGADEPARRPARASSPISSMRSSIAERTRPPPRPIRRLARVLLDLEHDGVRTQQERPAVVVGTDGDAPAGERPGVPSERAVEVPRSAVAPRAHPLMMSYGSGEDGRIVSNEVPDVLDDPEQLLAGVQRDPSAALARGAAVLARRPDAAPPGARPVDGRDGPPRARRAAPRPRATSSRRGRRRSSSAMPSWPRRSPSRCRSSSPTRASWTTRWRSSTSPSRACPRACADACAASAASILYQQGDFAAALGRVRDRAAAARRERRPARRAAPADEHRRPAQLPRPARRGPHRTCSWPSSSRVDLDQTLAQAVAEQNLAHVGALVGDFPAAFESFERAARRFEQLQLRRAAHAVAAARPRPRAAAGQPARRGAGAGRPGRRRVRARPRASSTSPRASSSPPRPTSRRRRRRRHRRRRAQRRRVRRP